MVQYSLIKKLKKKVINDQEDWKRYRDDSWSISLNTSEIRETEKTSWMNDNIDKDKIKFTMDISQKELVFLDTKIRATEIDTGKVVLTSDIYSKKTDTHQYLSPKLCHPEHQIETIPIGVE